MKTKTIEVFSYDELSTEAKERALAHYRENDFDSYGLQVHLDNLIADLLEKNHITPVTDTKGYETKYAKVYYSLSNSQGDGVMFENNFNWKEYRVRIKQSGRYYHSYSKDVEIVTLESVDAQDEVEAGEGIYLTFEKIYQSICKELEKAGYEYIEDMESEEAFIEACNANDYTFRADGTMENI